MLISFSNPSLSSISFKLSMFFNSSSSLDSNSLKDDYIDTNGYDELDWF